MNLTKKIILLVVCQVLVIVGCLYFHLEDFNTNDKQILKVEEEKIEEVIIDTIEVTKEVTENTRKIEQSEQTTIEKPNDRKSDTSDDMNLEVVESSEKKENISNNNIITDEKVKKIFEKKQASISDETVEDKYEKIDSSISKIIEKNKIVFKRLSTDVSEKSISTIKQIAQILKDNLDVKVEVGGHTDAKGDDIVNNYVSKQRALSVKKMLIEFGIDENRLTSKGYGETQPLVENSPDGYSMENRRVEFKLIKE